MIRILMYLDGKTVGCGCRFVVTRDGSAWTAFRTVRGFKYFLDEYGLKIDRNHTRMYDLRGQGEGRCIVTACYPKDIAELYFWDMKEVPEGAKPHIQTVNGSYVHCYLLHRGGCTVVYKPNPNAKDVYVPFDYWAVNEKSADPKIHKIHKEKFQ